LAARRKTDVEKPKPSAKIRVLAVDDDRSYLKYLQFILKKAGFDVVVASDGASAIEQIRNDPGIGLLLVDLAMPRMDGIETVRQIQMNVHASDLYTILLTAHDGTDVKLRAFDGGLDDFITKTTPEAEIVAKVRSAARRLEMERRLHLENEELQTLALTDELTGIANRRALLRAGEALLSGPRSLSLVLFDLDHFKRVNDSYGHVMGDRILADVAACLKARTRVGDVIARYGGDEFVLLLPETDERGARTIAMRIAESVAELRWQVVSGPLQVTVTFGVSGLGTASSIGDMIAVCDRALFARKRRLPDGSATALRP
jgi:two-component system cell cycle response regulator